MNPFKDRTDALNTLVFMFEDRGLFVTAADLAPLANTVLTPGDGDTVSLTCSISALFDRAAELVPEFGQPAECAHDWCTGDRATHSSLNPRERHHTGTEDELAPGGMLVGGLSRAGDGTPRYLLEVDPSAELGLTAAGVLALADDFERHALTLRARAAQLADLGGTQ